MELFGKNLSKEVVVVAEIGPNHEGSTETAASLVEAAADAGADAVKFQSYTPARFIAANNPDRLARVAKFSLSEEAHRQLADLAKSKGIAFVSTPVTEDWVPLLAELCPAIKIASGDLNFEQLIEVHFTDKKTGRTFRDHELSFEPDDLRKLIESIKRVRQCLGTQEKKPMPCEAENRDEMRKGVVAARDIAAGTTLQREDLMYARPGTEIPAAKLENQVGGKQPNLYVEANC